MKDLIKNIEINEPIMVADSPLLINVNTKNITIEEPFIRGPIKYEWAAKASKLRGPALSVGVLIWFQYGLQKERNEIKLQTKFIKQFGLSRHQVRRGLCSLEKSKLIKLRRAPGQKPIISLHDHHLEKKKRHSH